VVRSFHERDIFCKTGAWRAGMNGCNSVPEFCAL
jgi:hypothetical protein